MEASNWSILSHGIAAGHRGRRGRLIFHSAGLKGLVNDLIAFYIAISLTDEPAPWELLQMPDENMISKEDFIKVLKKCKSAESAVAEASGNLGDLISTAVENKNLHKKAFGLTRQCSRMDPVKLYAFLQAFDAYREYSDLDKLAGKSLDLEEEKAAAETAPEKKTRGRPRKPPVAPAENVTQFRGSAA